VTLEQISHQKGGSIVPHNIIHPLIDKTQRSSFDLMELFVTDKRKIQKTAENVELNNIDCAFNNIND